MANPNSTGHVTRSYFFPYSRPTYVKYLTQFRVLQLTSLTLAAFSLDLYFGPNICYIFCKSIKMSFMEVPYKAKSSTLINGFHFKRNVEL